MDAVEHLEEAAAALRRSCKIASGIADEFSDAEREDRDVPRVIDGHSVEGVLRDLDEHCRTVLVSVTGAVIALRDQRERTRWWDS